MPWKSPRPSNRIVSAKGPRNLIERLRAAAHSHGRTLSGQLRAVIREWAEGYGGNS